MWIHKSTAKVDPSNKDKLIEILSTDRVYQTFRTHKGFQAYYLVEKLGAPAEMASITFWDTQEEGEAFYASPIYREIISAAIPLLVEKPLMEAFGVKVECKALISALG